MKHIFFAHNTSQDRDMQISKHLQQDIDQKVRMLLKRLRSYHEKQISRRLLSVSLFNNRTIETYFQKICKVSAWPAPYCDSEQNQKSCANICSCWRAHTHSTLLYKITTLTRHDMYRSSAQELPENNSKRVSILDVIISHNCCKQKSSQKNIQSDAENTFKQ